MIFPQRFLNIKARASHYLLKDMLDPKISHQAEGETTTLSQLVYFQELLRELLELLTEITQEGASDLGPRYPSLIDPLLHVLTDVETQIISVHATLERDRLIFNDLIETSREELDHG